MPQYRIRNSLTGLYSTGGNAYNISWTKTGKVWTSLGNLKNHLAQMPCIPDHWVVEECALVCVAEVPRDRLEPKRPRQWTEYDEWNIQRDIEEVSKSHRYDDQFPSSLINQKRRYLLAFHPGRWDGLVDGEPWKPI